MSVSTVVLHWWLRVYIVFVIYACSARSIPIIQQLKSTNRQLRSPQQETSEKNYCGEELVKALFNICTLYHSMFDIIEKGQGPGEVHSAVDMCCTKPCTSATLRGFCRQVRKEPLETDHRTEESDNQQEPSYYDVETATLGPIASAQTGPTNRPEFAYAGEYWDQEPLTLLPTYTSPDYILNMMQRW